MHVCIVQIRSSNKPESVEMRMLMYSFLAADGSLRSQQVLFDGIVLLFVFII